MILKMEKLSVFGLLGDRQPLLDELMRGQCIQMRQVEMMDNYEEVASLTSSAPVESYAMEQQLSRYSAALASINFYAKKRGMFSKRPRVLYDALEDSAMLGKAEEICDAIERTTAAISAQRTARSKNLFTQASLAPWADSDLPLELEETKTTSVLYYLLPAKTDYAALEQQVEEQAPNTVLYNVSQDKEQIYLLAICHNSCQNELWDVLKSLGATKMSFAGLTGTAQENIALLASRVEAADAEIARLEGELGEIGQDIFPLQYGFDVLTIRTQKEKAGLNLRSTQKTFCFTAWVPEVRKEDTAKILEQYGCYYEFAQPAEDEEPPILLQNAALVTPYETVTEMYSLPSYRGFDPNNFVAVFYFIIFGMMMGDAGFGLCLFLGGLWFGKKSDMGPNAKKLINVITMGGVSTIIWGIIYGSFFGDTIQSIGKAFFGMPENWAPITPLLDPIENAVIVMVLCLAIGVIHLFVGMGIKGYMLIKRGQAKDALFDIGFWYLFLIGLIMMLAYVGAPIVIEGAVLPSFLMDVGKWLAIAGAVLLILTQGRSNKNPIMKILNGITSLYDITSYLSDVLSYSRILALGLATGVIAQVFNIIGTLPVQGGINGIFHGVFGVIFYIVIFAIGTGLNLGINTLGAYVHTARLQYVEFFGKFYETGGRPFTPFMPQTKYIVVTNKEEN